MDRGLVWIFTMNRDGSVKNQQKISTTEGNFNEDLDSAAIFGHSVSWIDDLNGDNIPDLLLGSPRYEGQLESL